MYNAPTCLFVTLIMRNYDFCHVFTGPFDVNLHSFPLLQVIMNLRKIRNNDKLLWIMKKK